MGWTVEKEWLLKRTIGACVVTGLLWAIPARLLGREAFGPRDFPLGPLTLVLALALTLVLHEGLHALVAKLAGHGVKFGWFKWRGLVVGAYVSMKEEVQRGVWIAIAAAPMALTPALLALSTVGGPASGLLSMLSLMNAFGCGGDLVLVLVAAGSPRGSRVLDLGDRAKIVGRAPRPAALALADAVTVFGYSLLALFVLTPILVAIAGCRVAEVCSLVLVEYVREREVVRVSVSINLTALLLLALLPALVAGLRTYAKLYQRALRLQRNAQQLNEWF